MNKNKYQNSEDVMREIGFVFSDPTDIYLEKSDKNESSPIIEGEDYDMSKMHERLEALHKLSPEERKDAFVSIGKNK
ncbi:MAG: hypothetical protein AABY32_02610 [Nanoarchaeota archaeon]